ncbi:hypothetical protein D3C87_1990360 [compost metagenome]
MNPTIINTISIIILALSVVLISAVNTTQSDEIYELKSQLSKIKDSLNEKATNWQQHPPTNQRH